jgi:hypothetical protein
MNPDPTSTDFASGLAYFFGGLILAGSVYVIVPWIIGLVCDLFNRRK